MKYRSRFDIVGEIMQSAVGGATKTRMMYDAFLSHNQVQEYLDFLLGKEMISLAPDKKHYVPTEKGLRFLATHDEIKNAVTIQKTEGVSMEQHESAEVDDLDGPSRPRLGRGEPADRG